jgi:hypothetical protein
MREKGKDGFNRETRNTRKKTGLTAKNKVRRGFFPQMAEIFADFGLNTFWLAPGQAKA